MGRKEKVSAELKLQSVQEYLSGVKGAAQIRNELQIHDQSLRIWLRKYETLGAEGLIQIKKNAYYPESLIIQAITDYQSGRGSYEQICKVYNISSSSILQNWIKKYNSHETLRSHNAGGDRTMTNGRKTTFQERIEIVSFCIENNDNYQLTAEKYQVSYQQVYTWEKKYKEGGLEALADRRGKRRDPEAMTETEKLATHVKLLEAENKRLQMENGFLKKLKEVERRRTGKTNI